MSSLHTLQHTLHKPRFIGEFTEHVRIVCQMKGDQDWNQSDFSTIFLQLVTCPHVKVWNWRTMCHTETIPINIRVCTIYVYIHIVAIHNLFRSAVDKLVRLKYGAFKGKLKSHYIVPLIGRENSGFSFDQ